MDRRTLLRTLAALGATAVGAGCTNNQEVPATAPELPVTATEGEMTEVPDGNGDQFDPPTPPTGGTDDGPGDVNTIPGNVNTRGSGTPTPTETAQSGGGTPTAGERTPTAGERTPTAGERTPTATDTPTPRSPIEGGGFDLESDDDGDLVVVVTVRNVSDSEQTATVVVAVDADGQTDERSATRSISSDTEVTVRLGFPVAYDPDAPPSVNVTISEGTPTAATATDGS